MLIPVVDSLRPHAQIFMSDIKDEIDWEFTTANATDAQTNYFGMGQYVATHGQTIKTNSSFSVSDWHTFGVNWQPDQLQWKIDGNVVRTLKKSDAGGYFPRSPSRVQFSTWAGGNETNAQGTIDWSGGPIDWSSDEYKKNGYYSQEIKQLVVNCASQNVANISTDGTGNDVTAWYYTGANSSSTGEPEFKMTTNAISTLKDPAKDGVPGMPGYSSSSSSGSSSSSSGSSFSNKNGSTSSSENNSNPNWSFNKNAALKYGIPIAAAGVGLILLWALIVALIRRRRNAKLAAPGAAGLAANSASSAFGGGAAGLATRGGGIGNTSRYAPLHDVDDAPAGARRVGHGYAGGPAQGQGARYAGAGYGGYEAYDMQTRHEMSPAPSRGYGHQQQPSLGGSPYPYREPRYTGYRD